MAGSWTDYLKNEMLDHVLSASTFTAPATLYVGLWTSALFDSATGSVSGEVSTSGTNYARAAVTNNTTNFPAASGGIKTNGTTISFSTASISWGTITYMALTDAITGGNMLMWSDLTTSKAVAAGDTPSFSVGSLTFSVS